jgi:hypothetical protein
MTNMTYTLTMDGSTIDNPCNGEVVTLSGGLRHDLHVHIYDAQHVEHDVSITNMHLTGTGSYGNTYYIPEKWGQVVGIQTEDRGYCYDDYCMVTIAGSFILTSRGSAPNFRAHLVEHVTYTPDGTVTSVVWDYSAECLGWGPPQPPPEPPNP